MATYTMQYRTYSAARTENEVLLGSEDVENID